VATKTPLRVMVMPPVDQWKDEIAELEAKGHTVEAWSPLDTDLVVGEKAWHMAKVHKSMLATAVEAAQKRVKGKR
jgi:hypothetical protein